MKFGGILGQTVAASVILAAFAVPAAFVAGRPMVGLGLAAGVVIGSFNGHALMALMNRQVPFVGASILRMTALSAIAILVALVAGAAPWAVLLGVAAAQLVMVAAAVRQGLRT